MFSIGVYVTSRYKNFDEFKVTLDEALKKYISTGKPNAICTGSSKSNDSGNGLVKRYAFEAGIPCRVFETQWANNIPTKPGKKNTAGVRANAMIIRNSNACVLFWAPTAIAKWDFMSGGCYNFRKMCGKMGRELIEIKVDIYKPIEKTIDNEVDDETNAAIGANVDTITSTISPDGLEMISHSGSIEPSMPSAVGGGVGGGGGRMPPPQATDNAASDNASDVPDANAVNVMQNIPSSPSLQTQGGISEIPIDINGDGTPDSSITAIDTNNDGTPDSQLTPVDLDNNGTIDKVELTPLQNTQQQVAAPTAQGGVDAAAVQQTDDNSNQQQ